MDQPATTTRAQAGFGLLVVVAAWVWYAGPLAWNSGHVFLGDAGMLDVPRRLYAARELRSGRCPWWTSDLACGFPLFAESQVGLLYPPNWLLILSPTAKTFDRVFAAHYLLAGLGVWGWLRARGLAGPSAVLGGVFFLSAPLAARLQMAPGIWEIVAWLPWSLWGLRRLRQGVPWTPWGLAVVHALMVLAGYPPVSLIAFCLIGLAWLFSSRGVPSGALVREALLLFGLPLLLSAAQWLPLGAFAGDSTRAGALAWPAFQAHRVPWRELASFGLPPLDPQPAYRGRTDWSLAGHWLAWLWLVPALWGREGVRRQLGGAALVLAGVLLASWTPAQFLLWQVPIFNRFRWHNLYLVWSLVGGTLLVSAGFDRTLAWFARRQAEHPPRGSWLAWGLAFSSAAVWVARPLSQYASTVPFYEGAHPRLVAAARAGGHFRLWPASDAHEEAARRGRVNEEAMLASRAILPADFSLWERVPNARLINQHDTVSPGALTELWHEGNAYRAGLSRLWRVAAVTDVTTLRALPPEWLADLEPRDDSGVLWYRLRAPRPRAWLVHQAEVWPDTGPRLARLASPKFDPARQAVVEAPVSLEPRGAFPPQVACREVRPGALELHVTTPSQGLLVVADRYTRDTRAWLDGRPAPLLQTNHAFRGVVVPAGRHTVSMRYCPRGLGWGAACSLAGWGIWICGAWRALGWRGRHRVNWLVAAVVLAAEFVLAAWQLSGGCV